MNKYRVKLNSGRVIGPIDKDQIKELYKLNHIKGGELCQVFPAGDWLPIAKFFDPEDLIVIKKQEKTGIINLLSLIKGKNKKNNDFQYTEFTFKEERKIGDSKRLEQLVSDDLLRKEDKDKVEIIEERASVEEKIIERNPDATYLFNSSNALSVEELKKIEEEAIAFDKLKNSLEEEKLLNEKNNQNQSRITKITKQIKEKKKMSWIVAFSFLVVVYMILFDDPVTKQFSPKVPNIAYPISADVPNVEKSIELYNQGLKLYDKYSYEQKNQAASFFRRSLELNRDEAVLGKLVFTYSELLFHIVDWSLFLMEKKSEGVNDQQDLISLKEKASNIVFKLVKEGRLKSLSSIDIVLGTALFYEFVGKYRAGIFTLLRYQIRGGSANLYYYSILLDLLRLDEKLEIAKPIYEKLLGTNDKGVTLTLSLSRFAMAIFDYETAYKLLFAAGKKFPDSVAILLEFSNVLVYKNDFKQLGAVLKALEVLNLDNSPMYYADFLKLKGMFEAYRKNYKEASKYFKSSLLMKESIDLRQRLALLDDSKNLNKDMISTNDLIVDSKIYEAIQKSKHEMENYNYQLALKYAIDAVDLKENNVKAKLYLADLQIKRGYFSEAQSSLVQLNQAFPSVDDIKLALIRADIESYAFKEAMDLLLGIDESKNRRFAEYSSLRAYWYFKSDDYLRAYMWLKKAIRLDPLNDNNYYIFAKTLLKIRKTQEAKNAILQAIELNPEKIEYKIFYSEIIYLLNGVEETIGYLNLILKDSSLLPDFSDNLENTEMKIESEEKSPADKVIKITEILKEISKIKEDEASIVLSEIAIYYYKSGQIDQFNRYKKILENKYRGSKVFYEFFIKASEIDGKKDLVYQYSKSLIELDPGDLKARMDFGRFLLDEGKTDESLGIFFSIKERLSSYPKVLYYISKIYLLKNDLGKAKEFAKLEINQNPNLEYGQLLLGDIYTKEGSALEAREAYKLAQSKNSNSVDALIGIANIDFKENQLDRALELYLKSSRLTPNNPYIWKQISSIYKAQGQRTNAIQAAEQYLNLKPDAEDAAEIKISIEKMKNY